MPYINGVWVEDGVGVGGAVGGDGGTGAAGIANGAGAVEHVYIPDDGPWWEMEPDPPPAQVLAEPVQAQHAAVAQPAPAPEPVAEPVAASQHIYRNVRVNVPAYYNFNVNVELGQIHRYAANDRRFFPLGNKHKPKEFPKVDMEADYGRCPFSS